MKRGNCAAPTESYFDLSVSQHWSSIGSNWRLVGALSTSTANGLLSSSNLYLGFKVGKSPGKLGAECAELFNKLRTWKHVGRDLLFNVLAARKMAPVSLQHLSLPQAQLGFKSPHRSVHICNDTAPPLKLQVEHIEMAQDVLQKYQLTQNLSSRSSVASFPLLSIN